MPKIDETWLANRRLKRKDYRGSELKLDPLTGYLESARNWKFNARKKALFIERLKICKNERAIAKSVGTNINTIFDHIMVDPKFREDYNKCLDIPDRAKNLNTGLKIKELEPKMKLIDELSKAMAKYVK